jgi:hypothetical protein
VPASCAKPGPAIEARVQQLLARVSVEPAQHAPTIRYGCEQATGWPVEIDEFKPAPSFAGGTACTPLIAAGPCDTVSATWRVPASGPPQLWRDEFLGASLDFDGDGTIESLTGNISGARTGKGVRWTIWFDAGRKPVPLPVSGDWIPRDGKQLLAALDGSYPAGFFMGASRAFTVSPAGVVEHPELVSELWQRTRAAHCPRSAVVADAEPLLGPEPVPATCALPARTAALEAEIVAAVTERIRQRGSLLAQGKPTFAWACAEAGVTALVTYCEGDAAGACNDEKGTLVFELWTHTAGGMRRLDRTTSGSLHLEWAPYTSVKIAAYLDVDGDGRLDPIVQTLSGEGGGGELFLVFAAVAHERLAPITSFTARKNGRFVGPMAVPWPGHPPVLAFMPFASGEYANEPELAPATVWQLDGASFRQLRGASARALLQAASRRWPPP